MAPHAAVMVVLPMAMLVASPLLSMVAMEAAEELHKTELVISSVELSLKVPVAVNCLTALAGMEDASGAIARETKVALVTVIEAVAEMVPEIAVTVEVPGPTATPRPLASMVRTLTALDDQRAEVRT